MKFASGKNPWPAIAAAIVISGWVTAVRSEIGAGDVRSGRAITAKWCVHCHLALSTQKAAPAGIAPPFVTIGDTRTDDYIRGFLINPHPAMEGFLFSRDEIDDLTAYIRSLSPLGQD